MNRRNFLKASGAAAAGAGFAACSPQADSHNRSSSAPKSMNHLFFIVDDLNLSLGCYGSSEVYTPNIDRLAASGTVFENAYCPYPLCGPSRTAMLTGKRPESIPMPINEISWRQLQPTLKSLPQLFRESGYQTAGFGKLFHHGITDDELEVWRESHPNQRNPHTYKDPASWDISGVEEKPNIYEKKATGPEQIIDGRPHGGTSLHSVIAEDSATLPDTLSAEAAAAFLLEQENADKPFFLGVGFHKPHVPFIAPQKWWDYYNSLDVDSLKPPTWFHPAKVPEGTLMRNRFHRDMDEAQRIHCYKGYLACVSYMDEQLGRVMQALEAAGFADSTTISFVADHGYHLGEHAQWDKMQLLDPSLRVPMILSGPGIPSGKRCAATVESIDLFGTLGALHGIKHDQDPEGQLLQPWIENPEKPSEQPAFSWVHAGRRQGWSIRTDRYRYGLTSFKDGPVEPYLFDYDKDPEETTNLLNQSSQSPLVKQLDSQLRQHFANTQPIPEA